MLEDCFQYANGSITFWLKVRPRSSQERLAVDQSGALILNLHAAPADGEANDSCIRFLARALRLPRSSITIVSGERSRRKLLRICGPSAEQVAAQLSAIIAR